MKTLLYVIASSLLLLWGVIIWGFNVSYKVHILLVLAVIIIAIAVYFNKRLSDKTGVKTKRRLPLEY